MRFRPLTALTVVVVFPLVGCAVASVDQGERQAQDDPGGPYGPPPGEACEAPASPLEQSEKVGAAIEAFEIFKDLSAEAGESEIPVVGALAFVFSNAHYLAPTTEAKTFTYRVKVGDGGCGTIESYDAASARPGDGPALTDDWNAWLTVSTSVSSGPFSRTSFTFDATLTTDGAHGDIGTWAYHVDGEGPKPDWGCTGCRDASADFSMKFNRTGGPDAGTSIEGSWKRVSQNGLENASYLDTIHYTYTGAGDGACGPKGTMTLDDQQAWIGWGLAGDTAPSTYSKFSASGNEYVDAEILNSSCPDGGVRMDGFLGACTDGASRSVSTSKATSENGAVSWNDNSDFTTYSDHNEFNISSTSHVDEAGDSTYANAGNSITKFGGSSSTTLLTTGQPIVERGTFSTDYTVGEGELESLYTSDVSHGVEKKHVSDYTYKGGDNNHVEFGHLCQPTQDLISQVSQRLYYPPTYGKMYLAKARDNFRSTFYGLGYQVYMWMHPYADHDGSEDPPPYNPGSSGDGGGSSGSSGGSDAGPSSGSGGTGSGDAGVDG